MATAVLHTACGSRLILETGRAGPLSPVWLNSTKLYLFSSFMSFSVSSKFQGWRILWTGWTRRTPRLCLAKRRRIEENTRHVLLGEMFCIFLRAAGFLPRVEIPTFPPPSFELSQSSEIPKLYPTRQHYPPPDLLPCKRVSLNILPVWVLGRKTTVCPDMVPLTGKCPLPPLVNPFHVIYPNCPLFHSPFCPLPSPLYFIYGWCHSYRR